MGENLQRYTGIIFSQAAKCLFVSVVFFKWYRYDAYIYIPHDILYTYNKSKKMLSILRIKHKN